MNKYLAFFGSSHGFNSVVFDLNGISYEFKESIQERGLLESSVFTTDDTRNKEILARYIFKVNGKSYSLLKLYSFAQAANISRIDGCTFGVALISDGLIKLSNTNLSLLRAAKDSFAKLSLSGLKFSKTNFDQDVSRIWSAIVQSDKGNLLEKTEVDALVYNDSSSPVAFFVKNLFFDAEKLNDRVVNQDIVYFSEDFEHLKRAQNKCGKDDFPVYLEKGNQFVIYKEPPPPPPPPPPSPKEDGPIIPINKDSSNLNDLLLESKGNNQNLQQQVAKLKKSQKASAYLIYGLTAIILVLLVYIIFFSNKRDVVAIEKAESSENTVFEKPTPPSDFFVGNADLADTGIDFLKATQFVYSFDVKDRKKDTAKLYSQFVIIQKIAKEYNIKIDSVEEVYLLKCREIKKMSSELVQPQRVIWRGHH